MINQLCARFFEFWVRFWASLIHLPVFSIVLQDLRRETLPELSYSANPRDSLDPSDDFDDDEGHDHFDVHVNMSSNASAVPASPPPTSEIRTRRVLLAYFSSPSPLSRSVSPSTWLILLPKMVTKHIPLPQTSSLRTSPPCPSYDSHLLLIFEFSDALQSPLNPWSHVYPLLITIW